MFFMLLNLNSVSAAPYCSSLNAPGVDLSKKIWDLQKHIDLLDTLRSDLDRSKSSLQSGATTEKVAIVGLFVSQVADKAARAVIGSSSSPAAFLASFTLDVTNIIVASTSKNNNDAIMRDVLKATANTIVQAFKTKASNSAASLAPTQGTLLKISKDIYTLYQKKPQATLSSQVSGLTKQIEVMISKINEMKSTLRVMQKLVEDTDMQTEKSFIDSITKVKKEQLMCKA